MDLIYLVEDDESIKELEMYALSNSGFDVVGFEKSEEFYKACEKQIPDLVLLDIMLPSEDGIGILKTLRGKADTKDVPIIMVTAKSTELDRVKGLDLGADDYIGKPFGVMELISRVRAVLRRAGKTITGPNEPIEYKNIRLEEEKRQVTVGSVPCELTFKEFELLKYLMLNKEKVLTREKIMDQVWGYNYEGESRTVDMHIKTLRQKLGDYASFIKTIRNVGYKIGD